MKKIIFIVITVMVAIFVYINVNADEIVIPSSAIRVRVIANSNTIYDQSMKMKVKEYVESYLYPKLIDVDNIEEARKIIQNSQEEMSQGIDKLFQENDYDRNFVINFGDNYFPSKEYKGVRYEAGEYESLVISIGEGNGDNWWCVLFPPLCLLEASENEDTDGVEYRFFVQEMLDKIF